MCCHLSAAWQEADRKRQWCSGCAKEVPSAVNINLLQRHENKMGIKHPKVKRKADARMCVTCKVVRPVFGMPDANDRCRQWCSGCAKEISGAVNINLLQRKENEAAGKAPRAKRSKPSGPPPP